MKNTLHFLILILSGLAVFGERYPTMDKPTYMYVYPTINQPQCRPPSPTFWTEWASKYQDNAVIEDTQNLAFYNDFQNRVKKDGVNEFVVDVANSKKKCTFMMSRVVLCANLLRDIRSAEIDNKIKVDRLYFVYGHADDFSYMGCPAEKLPHFNSRTRMWDGDHMYREYTPNFDTRKKEIWDRHSHLKYLQPKPLWLINDDQYAENPSKKEARLFTLNKLEERGTKVFIYNRFYNIPDYIKDHRNVTILSDKTDSGPPQWEPNYYQLTDKNGRTINAGFMGIAPRGDRTRKMLYQQGFVALKVRGNKFYYNVRNLNDESREKIRKILGNYKFYI